MGTFVPPPLSSREQPSQDQAFVPPPLSSRERPSAASRFGQGFWQNTIGGLVDTAEAAADLVGQGISHPGYIDPTSKGGQMIHGMIQSHIDQGKKAIDAWNRGEHVEALGHLGAAAIPLVGPAAAHAAERMGGTEAVYDKYGNIVQPGQAPDIAGGLGEGAGLITSTLAAPKVEQAVGTVADVAKGPVGEAAWAGTKAAAPDVAKGAARMTVAGGVAKVPIPGSQFAAWEIGRGAAKQIARGIKKGAATAKETYSAAKQAAADEAAAAAEQAAGPDASEAYYASQAGGRHAPEPTSEEYYAQQPGGRAAEPPPTPEQQAAADAQTARDAHEADFRDKATESLSDGAVKRYDNLEDKRAISVVDRLTREEMARYDRQAQAAAPPPEAPPEPTPKQPPDEGGGAAPAAQTPPGAPPGAPPAAAAPPIPPGVTIEDLLRQDLAQRRAARPPEPTPAERLGNIARDVFSRQQPAPPQPSVVPANPSLAELQDAMRALIERRRAEQAPGEAPTPPEMPVAAPQEPTSAPEGTPAAPTRQETVAKLSDALNRMLAGETAPAARDFPAEARATRADLAGKFADYLPSKGVTAEDVAAMNDREQLLPHAREAGLDIPKSPDAFVKLRDAIVGELQRRTAAKPNIPPVRPYPPPEGFFSPSAIQKLIDIQERRARAAP